MTKPALISFDFVLLDQLHEILGRHCRFSASFGHRCILWFQFPATFEPTDDMTQFMAFRIGYGVIGLGCLLGIGILIAKALRR